MKKLLFTFSMLFFVNIIFAQETDQELLKTSEFFLKSDLNNSKSYKRTHYSIERHYLYDSLVEELSTKERTKIYYTEKLGDLNNQKQLNQTQKVEWLRLTNDKINLINEKIDLNNNEINSLRDSIVYYKNLIDSCDKSLSFLSDKIKRKEKLSSVGIYATYGVIFIGGFFTTSGLALMTGISTPLLAIHTSVTDYGKNAFLGKKYKSLKDEYYSVNGLKNSYEEFIGHKESPQKNTQDPFNLNYRWIRNEEKIKDENRKSCEYRITELNKENVELNKEINKLKEGFVGYEEFLQNNPFMTFFEVEEKIKRGVPYYELEDKKLNKDILSHTNRIEELTKEIELLKIRISNTNKKQVRRYDVGISFNATNQYGGIVKCQYHISYDSNGNIIEYWSNDKTGVFNETYYLTH